MAIAAQKSYVRPADFPDRPQGFLLGIDDILEVKVWREPELSLTVLVRPDGRITVPLAGEVVAAERTPEDLQEEITRKLRQYVRNPSVAVMVKQVKSARIYVLGKVNKPNVYVLFGSTSVLDAIAMAGGPKSGAFVHQVVILRPTTTTARQRIELDLKRLLRDHDSGEIRVHPRDVVYLQ